MAITPLPIANGSYQSISPPLSAQRCVNWYPHIPDRPSLATETLLGCPGIRQVATAGATPLVTNRGARRMRGKAYFVQGQTLYRLNADHTLDSLGAISGMGRVSMSDNGTQLIIIVPGSGVGYIFTESPDTLTTISAAGFTANGNPTYVTFVDSYFICTTDDDKYILSGVKDGLSWNALDFGSAEASPDSVVIPFVHRNQLFIAGERTIEGFQNIGGADFPFQRSGVFFDEGVKVPFSLVNTHSAVMWVGSAEDEEPGIWRLEGGQTAKVSTQAIDQMLQRMTEAELAEIYAWSYGQDGHLFTGFVLADTVIVFDAKTGRWHDRLSRYDLGSGNFATIPHRGRGYVTAYGNTYVADSLDGRIGLLDPDEYQEYGEEILCDVIFQPFQNNQQSIFVPMLEVTVESGVGNSDEPDPQIRLQTSRDGGRTWGDERQRAMGKQGEYSRRAIWRRNGRFDRAAVFRLRMSDPVKRVVLQMTADVRGEAA